MKLTAWVASNLDFAIPPLGGRRVLVTGANSGVGYSAALALLRHGADLLLACRDRTRGEAALARIRSESSSRPIKGIPPGHAELVLLDLASLASIRSVADALLIRGLPLDVLVNNAGVMAPPRRHETADGLELQFGTNVVGHFALTGLLLPLLERSAATQPGPRVVTLASIAHKRGHLALDDLQSLRGYSPRGAYYQSKLADLVFAMELERRLRAVGSPVSSLPVHPGVAQTELFKVGSGTGLARVAERALARTIGLLLNSELDGAVPTLYAATDPEAVGGAYYGPQGFQEMRGGDVGLAQVAPQALGPAINQRLWTACQDLSGVSYLNPPA
jgi:NAD(P)-dependent dehydrogenase (short-subunit alcohol dehydrogenase family)